MGNEKTNSTAKGGAVISPEASQAELDVLIDAIAKAKLEHEGVVILISDGNVELSKIKELIELASAEHEKVIILVNEKQGELSSLASQIAEMKEVQAKLYSDIEAKRSELLDLDTKSSPLFSGTKSIEIPNQEVDVKFVIHAFVHKGVEYKSSELEKAASAGDEEALLVIEELIEMKAGVIEVTEKGGK